MLTFPLLLIPSGPNCPAKSETAVPKAPGRSKHGGPGNCKVQTFQQAELARVCLKKHDALLIDSSILIYVHVLH